MKTKNQILLVIALFVLLIIGCETTKPDPIITGVLVSPSTATVTRGHSQQFTATVEGTNDPPQSVTWTISDGSGGSSINSNGVLFVSASEPASVLTVTARSTINSAFSSSATVNVTGAIITSVTISPKSINLAQGQTQQFTATVNGSHNPPQTVAWSISGNNSSDTSINSNGLLSIASNESANSIIVNVASTVSSDISDTATVTIASMGGTYNVTDIASWIEAIQGIRNGGNNRIHVINVTGEVNVNVNTEVTFGSVTNIQVTIQGGGTLALTAAGNILRIGLRHNIILQDVTLKGISTNTTEPVVYVAAGGVLTMRNEAVICENGGRGVIVDNGELNMEGGSIRDNITPWTWDLTGSGVYIMNGGTLTMSGNAQISNNVVDGWRVYGGGVHIGSNSTLIMEGGIISSNRTETTFRGWGGGIYIDGTLIMNGGEISYNIASGSSGTGGGVYITSTGSFIMNNGTLTGNNAGSLGGGVYVYNIFTQNGGTISNNSADRGGGVYIDSYRSYTMTGGTISGNNAGSNGGGVYVNSGNTIFAKTGGNIASNTASQNGNTAFSNTSPNKWRNANAGPNVNVDDLFWLND
ncbi:MAG: Ig-like domain-containing protein [Candidatus Cloacimonetes bacterium]|nr:Ig-like domain-containing protein [Candidatus Cloacimonadota bacterium]